MRSKLIEDSFVDQLELVPVLDAVVRDSVVFVENLAIKEDCLKYKNVLIP